MHVFSSPQSHLSTGGVKFRVIAVAAGGEGIDGTKVCRPSGRSGDSAIFCSAAALLLFCVLQLCMAV